MIHGYEALAFMIIYNVAMDNTRVISMLRWFRPLKLEPGFGSGWRWPESESGSYRKKLDTDQTEIKKTGSGSNLSKLTYLSYIRSVMNLVNKKRTKNSILKEFSA